MKINQEYSGMPFLKLDRMNHIFAEKEIKRDKVIK